MSDEHNADYVAPEGPSLGLATTRQMLRELDARFRISTPDQLAIRMINRLLDELSDEALDYRTVDSDGDQHADAVAVAEAHRDRLWQVYLEARADEREAFVNWQYACNAVETTKAHRRHSDGSGA